MAALKYKYDTGTRITKKVGRMRPIVMKVEPTMDANERMELKFAGRDVSRVSWSLLNLLTIRPVGVVSKNDMGDRMTRPSIPSWSREAALSSEELEKAEFKNDISPVRTAKPP